MRPHGAFTRRHCLLALAAALPACVTIAPPEAVPAAGVAWFGGLAFVNALPGSDRYRGGAVLRQTVAPVHDIAHRLSLRCVGVCGPKRAAEAGVVAGNAAALHALGLAGAASVTERDDGLAVWHVVAGSPAARAGLREGDVIERIGGPALLVRAGALDALREALGGDASRARSITLQLRRGPTTQVPDLRPDSSCDMPAVLEPDHGLAWAGGAVPLADAPGALLAFTVAHRAALRLDGPRRAVAIGGSDTGEGIDFTLTMLPLALGLATLGGWPAKPVDIFEGPAGPARGEAEARLRDEADLVADALALKVLHQAGLGAGPLFVAWQAAVDRTGQGRPAPPAASHARAVGPSGHGGGALRPGQAQRRPPRRCAHRRAWRQHASAETRIARSASAGRTLEWSRGVAGCRARDTPTDTGYAVGLSEYLTDFRPVGATACDRSKKIVV